MIGIVGAGAFGTALAVAYANDGQDVALWARSGAQVDIMRTTRRNDRYLAGITLPDRITVHDKASGLKDAQALLLCIPMQQLAPFLDVHPHIGHETALVACCKGIDMTRLQGPVSVILAARPAARVALLTGPSFAEDIARGLPTALTLASQTDPDGALQTVLSNRTIRLYTTDDVIGAELGGALKNVIAIAAGMVIGAGLGGSARAALMTRGYAEMLRLAGRLGARPETLAGLSGLGDLVLTCTSSQSRNFRFGLALGKGESFDTSVTVEGAATAAAVVDLSRRFGIDMPITGMVHAIVSGTLGIEDAVSTLMSRPLKQE